MSTSSDVAYLSRALKAPRVREVASRLAERAREEGWDYEAYLAAVLAEEVSGRETHGGQARVKAARFPQVKTLDDFDFTFQRSVKRELVSHLAQLDFLAEAKNVIFLGPPGTGKTHLSIALAVQAARRATGWPSPPPTSGCSSWELPSAQGGWRLSSSGWGGSPC